MASSVVVFGYFGVRFRVSGAAGKDASLVRLLRQARNPQWNTIGESDPEHHHHNSPAEATAEGHGSIEARCPRSGRAYFLVPLHDAQQWKCV